MSQDDERIENLLLALFYRHACPEPETLGDYYLGRLPPGQRLALAQHLRHCPHCTAELSLYEEGTEEQEGLVNRLHQFVSRVRWAFTAPNLLPSPSVRGTPYAQQAYQVDDTQIVIEVSPARTGYRRLDLMGQLQPAEATGDVELWDAGQAEIAERQPVEEMGYFEFRQLSPGDYFLCLRGDESETWVGPVSLTTDT